MKVAVCISGQARAVEENFSRLNDSIIRPNSADVFVHTWYDEQDVGKTFCGKSGVGNDGKKTTATLKLNTPKMIRSLYQPTLLQVDNQMRFVSKEIQEMNTSDENHPYRNRWSTRPQSVFSMFWSVYWANNLKCVHEMTTGIKYDAVIRARFDLMLEKEYDMKDYDMDEVYVDRHSHNSYSMQDTFAFSATENMDYYSSLYFQIPSLLSQGVEFCPEILLGAHLAQSGKKLTQLSNRQAPSYEIYR